MPSPYRREELIADTATLVYLLPHVADYLSENGSDFTKLSASILYTVQYIEASIPIK
jgi:hypothetical protein